MHFVYLVFIFCSTVDPGTNEGGEFYMGFITNNDGSAGFFGEVLGEAVLFITGTDPDSARITGRGLQMQVQIGPNFVSQSNIMSRIDNSTDRQGGVQIQVRGNGTAVTFAANQELFSVGGFMALPCPQQLNVERYEYYAISLPPNLITSEIDEFSSDSGFLVVSCSSDTLVTITPSQPVPNPNNPRSLLQPGNSTTVNLTQSGQTVYIQSSVGDLTGSRVVSNKPVSFFTGHECASFPAEAFSCDHIIEQVPPTANWGTTFLTAPIRSRDEESDVSTDLFKMVSSRIHTTVNVTCFSPQRNIPMRNISEVILRLNGDFFEFPASKDEFCSIEADKPIMVVQISANRFGEDTVLMSLVPAISQYRNNITFSVIGLAEESLEQWGSIFVPPQFFQPLNITLDGVRLSADGWTAIRCNSGGICGYARQEEIPGINVHSLRHDNSDAILGLIVYGHTDFVGYGYPGGLRLPLAERKYSS